MRVLLIEDDTATAQSIELMLKSEGFNVYTTDLGEEGVDLDRLGVEVDAEIAGDDDRLRMALGAAHHGVDAGNQLVLVERLGHVIVGAKP